MKQLSQAFKYEIIENLEYLRISSDNYNFNNIKKGDIIFVSKYKYNNQQEGQYHLFLVTKRYGIYTYGMLITSNIDKSWYPGNIELKKDCLNNLRYDSLIKTDNIYLIGKDNIINKIGSINKNIYNLCINLHKLQ